MDGWVPANCDISGKEMKLYASKRDEKPVVIEKMANFHKFVIESKEVTKMYGMISSCMQVRIRGEFVCPPNRIELSKSYCFAGYQVGVQRLQPDMGEVQARLGG